MTVYSELDYNGLLLMYSNRIRKQPSGCWTWCGYIELDGYGRVRFEGKLRPVHRVLYEAKFGKIANINIHIHHKCGIRRCVNIEHLEVITKAAHNTLHKKTFSSTDEATLIQEYTQERCTATEIAKEHNIHVETVLRVLKRHGISIRRGSAAHKNNLSPRGNIE